MGMRVRRYATLAAVLLLVIWATFVAALLLTFHPVASDWSTYYDTARALRLSPHANLWDYAITVAGGSGPDGCSLWPNLPYKYPPLLAIILAPLTYLPCGAATFVWRLVTLGLWIACGLALALPSWRAGRRGWALAAMALVMCYPPLIDGMLLGQVHLIILALILAGVALVANGRQVWGGAALAIGVWIKYAPGVIVVYYALTGRLRLAAGAVVAGLALLVAQLIIVGPASLLTSLNPSMLAVTGAVWDGWPGGSLWGIAAGAVFAIGVLLARWRGERPASDALGIGWALCAMLLASPVIQWLYLTWLLPAFWACLLEAARIARDVNNDAGWLRWAPLVTLALIFAVSLIPFNHLANSVTIIALFALCGTLYARSAIIPRARRRTARFTLPLSLAD